jgi:hypothetical protein
VTVFLEQNPKLRVVGVHLGSLEKDLDDIGGHFDKYPNFASHHQSRVIHSVASCAPGPEYNSNVSLG